MYVREIEGRELNLSVSGMLWDYSLVMQDAESESLWSHILGECVKGKYRGRKLEMLPSVLTDFATWKRLHPESTMLIWPHHFQPTWKNNVYEVLSYEKFVIGLIVGKEKIHFNLKDLVEKPVVNVTVGGLPIVLYFDRNTGAGWSFERAAGGELLEFSMKEDKVFDSTKSEWDLEKGRTDDGRLLKPVPNVPSTRTAWLNFHPDSQRWEPKENVE